MFLIANGKKNIKEKKGKSKFKKRHPNKKAFGFYIYVTILNSFY